MTTTITLTNEQQKAVDTVLEWIPFASEIRQSMEKSLGGYAGTGKTTILKYLLEHPDCAGALPCAYTGKAAFVLQTKGILDANTLHSTIYRAFEDPPGTLHFILRDDVDAPLIIVDEASMVSQEVYDDLMSLEIPVLWVGDHGQLEPVGSDPFVMASPDIRLETIHRQAQHSPIIQFAHFIREGGSPYSNGTPFTRSNEHGQVSIFSQSELEEHLDTDKHQLIVGTNNNRLFFNTAYRNALFPNSTSLLNEGERIICLKNNRKHGIFNGMMATVTKVGTPSSGIILTSIRDEMGREFYDLPLETDQFNLQKGLCKPHRSNESSVFFDYAYAITCHKSQGSEWEHIAIIDEPCVANFCDIDRWRYTAVTRASKSVTFFLS